MNGIYYYLCIPFSISVLGPISFLYFFCRYEAVRLTFLMKHLAILQLLDILVMVTWLLSIIASYPDNFTCILTISISDFLIIYQSYWLAAISYYTYQVVCLNKDRSKTCLLKFSLICSIISIVFPIIEICFDCWEIKSKICTNKCQDTKLLINNTFFYCIFPFGYIISFSYNLKVFKKLKKDIQNPTKLMKLTFFRILIYPFITILSSLPLYSYQIYYYFYGISMVYRMVAFISFSLMSLLYSLALGFTPEFIEALKFHKKFASSSPSVKRLISFRSLSSY